MVKKSFSVVVQRAWLKPCQYIISINKPYLSKAKLLAVVVVVVVVKLFAIDVVFRLEVAVSLKLKKTNRNQMGYNL